jgi:3-deoxy-D-arabino-heptulosonate 7-phosphate (DAHP) synthase class II
MKLTRVDSTSGNWLAGSGDLWSGSVIAPVSLMAHVELFCAGVQNPIV